MESLHLTRDEVLFHIPSCELMLLLNQSCLENDIDDEFISLDDAKIETKEEFDRKLKERQEWLSTMVNIDKAKTQL